MFKQQLVTSFAVATVFAAPALLAQRSYKREVPDSLAKQAKVTEEIAAKAALARVPKGEIRTVELERERGRLIYSYDIRVPGKSGIDEVGVSATTGKVVAFSHETPADEKKEAAADAKKAAKGTKKP